LKEEKILVKHKQNLKNGLMTLLSKDLSNKHCLFFFTNNYVGDTIKANLFPNIIEALNSENYTENLASLLTLQAILTSSNNLNSIILLYKETFTPLIQCSNKLLANISNNFSNLALKIIEVQNNTNTPSVFSNIQELNVEIQIIIYKYLISHYKNNYVKF